jgi:hypothetical protein
MSTDYIILSNTGAIGGGKRIRVIKDSWGDPSGQDMPELATLSNKVLTALDMDIDATTINVFARHTESDALYFTLAELKAIRKAPTAAARKLKFQDPLGVVTDVIWTNQWNRTYLMGPYIDGTSGWASVSLRLVKYQ